MRYGAIYLKVCPVEGSEGEWIKYCNIFSSMPKSFQLNTKEIVEDINTRYSEYMAIPMDIEIHPGCVASPEKVKEIAEDMYRQYSEMCERQGIPDSVRCVYSIGEMENVDVESIHDLYSYPVIVKLGRFLDESDEPGLFVLEEEI